MNRLLWITIMLAMLFSACGRQASGSDYAADSLAHRLPDTLRVATLYSPASYFIYRDDPMGLDYSLISDFVQAKGMTLDLQVAPSLARALDLLDSGKVDVVAYEVPVTAENRRRVAFTGPENLTHQVLVQPRSTSVIKDVTGLVGCDIYVPEGSKYHHRLINLDSELGGGINIHPISPDSVTEEDLLDRVAAGEIPLTVVDSDIARLNKTYYPNLDITMALSFDQRSRWAVKPSDKWLADSIDAYFGDDNRRPAISAEYRRYYELGKALPQTMTYDLSSGKISPYDDIFRQCATEIGWDWRLLAAQGFVESRFDNSLVSWAGARGIMQIMPCTARAHGVAPESLTDPGVSVRTAVKVIKATDDYMKKYVSDPEERRLFVLAAYNSGIAHIADAIALARKYGLNPEKWYGNVEKALLMKGNPEYYNDPVVKYGYFRGRQTTVYVRHVTDFYNRTIKSIRL